MLEYDINKMNCESAHTLSHLIIPCYGTPIRYWKTLLSRRVESATEPVVEFAKILAGALLSRVKLCRVARTFNERNELEAICKQRFPWSEALLFISNSVPRLSPNVRGLYLNEWSRWERQAWRIIHGCELPDGGNKITMPALPGILLSTVLSSPGFDDASKIQAVSAAARALYSAHALYAQWPDKSVHFFSHGDAHAGNVFYDPENACAYWFDFETVHDPSVAAHWRHADDLRALAYSCACNCPMHLWPKLAAAIAQAYPDGGVQRVLRDLSKEISCAPHLLHISQVPMKLELQRSWGCILRNVLEGAPRCYSGHALATNSGRTWAADPRKL